VLLFFPYPLSLPQWRNAALSPNLEINTLIDDLS